MPKESRRRPERQGIPKLEAIRSAIEAGSHGWEAGLTSVASLSEADRRSHLGLKVDPAELKATAQLIQAANQRAALIAVAAPPAAIDWRNNGGNFITPIRDQATCGSCVSFGTLATIEARANIACRTPGRNRDFSEAFLFYCGCGNCCGTGWNFPPALDYCKNTGVAAESSFPYTPGNQPCKSGVPVLFRIPSWAQQLSTVDRKTAIAERGPVVAGMAVYQDFFSYRSGVYRHATGNLAGYHAVSVIGYNDAEGCWIAKNSWGPGWGDAGFFKIAYGQCGIDSQFPFYDPQVPCYDRPEDTCRQYVVYLQRILVAARANLQLRACLRYYVCHRGPRPRCTPAQLAIVRTALAILARCPMYRLAFCRALG